MHGPCLQNIELQPGDRSLHALDLLDIHRCHMNVHLYLIRHGETVDNIAGLYAGVRDSALTNHGYDQARRLGDHFAKHDVKFTHIFASPLTRAFKTAELIHDAQIKANFDRSGEKDCPFDIVKVPDLIEQDFGFYEGKPFYARSSQNKNGKNEHREKHKEEPGFVDVESKDAMAKRADAFLDQHLLPILDDMHNHSNLAICIVSHGMLLSTLWRRLLLRLPRKSVTIAPEVIAARGTLILEHLGGWSNTGFLELALSKDTPSVQHLATNGGHLSAAKEDITASSSTSALPSSSGSIAVSAELPNDNISPLAAQPTSGPLHGWATTIIAVDSRQHLTGLKRQRGGIGRLAHDAGQKKLDGFFKKQKTS
nr:putative phosphatase [Quercus suber]